MKKSRSLALVMPTVLALSVCFLLTASSWSQNTNALPKEFSQAEDFLSAKRPADAIRILERLETQYKEGDVSIKVLAKLHEAYLQAKRTKDADRVAQKILTQYAGHPLSEPFQWNAVEKASTHEERAKLLKDYLKLFPKGRHAAAAQKRLQETEAEATMKKLQNASPLELRQAAEDFYNKREFAEALKLYQQLQKDAADKDFASFRIAFCHWWLHDYDKAVGGWLELADKMPKSKYAPEALQMAGRTYTGPLHDGEKALSLFRRITKDYAKSPEAEPAAYSIAILNYWMKRKQAAKNAFEDFIKTYPNSVYVPAAQKILTEL